MSNMPSSRSEFEKHLLSDGCDDWTGLYEIIWQANTTFAKENLAFKYGLAEESVRSLLQKGWIELVRRRSPWALADSQPEGTIDPDEWDDVISNPCSWYPCTPDNLLISYFTTELGRKGLGSILV
jgi:hypothetical protein